MMVTERVSAEQYQRMVRGAQNRRKGKAFEEMILASCTYYRLKGIAEIDKTPEPVKQLGKMDKLGRFTAAYEKKAQPDFSGTLVGGKSIVFEAKDTDADRMEQRAVNEEQTKALEARYQLGAECFVMVSFALQRFYRVPWALWRVMKEEFGRKYLKESELSAFRVRYTDGAIRFLDGIVKGEEE